MNWQLLLVGALVALAVAYLTRAAWRTWNVSRGGCGGGCGCSAGSKQPQQNAHVTLIPAERLTLRRPPESGNS